MLHEVIITLTGASGKFLENLENCVDLKPFIHPAEISILKKILKIASNFRYLKNFIEVNHVAIFGDTKNELQTLPGLYIQAFCEGLDMVLKPYRREIVLLEENILIGPQVTLIYIFSRVDKYSALFVLLSDLVKKIISDKIRGCKILQLLHDNILNSVDQNKECLECILKRCHIVFLRQTINWLVNGHLLDPFGEFIIQMPTKTNDCSDEKHRVAITNVKEHVKENYENNEYEIAVNRIPLYINYSLVNDIFFVGQTVRILNQNPRNDYDLTCHYKSLIFGEKEKLFFEKFESLKESMSINMKELEEVIHEIRICVVQHLWKVAVEEENLLGELQLLKNVYLLEYGQFFKIFLSTASVFSLHINKNQLLFDLNETFQQVASSAYVDEQLLTKFKFVVVPSKDKENYDSSDAIWSSIKLQYTAKWPLNLLFTPTAIRHYNKLFLFLLRIKRCYIEIYNVWKNDMKNKNVRSSRSWQLRNELMFLISNLQFYLQVDVIETEYCNLINGIQKVRDFQQIEKLHNIFLLNVLSHSFLLDVSTNDLDYDVNTPVTYSEHFYMALLNNLKICEKFCALASKGNLEKKTKEIEILNKNFQKYKNIVLCFLSEYRSQPFKQHVVKFLLRLNFNHWIGRYFS